MSYIKTFISDQIYDYFDYLYNTSDDDNDKNRGHLEPLRKIISEGVDCILYHEKYDYD